MVEESHIARVLEMVWSATLQLPLSRWDTSIIMPDIRNMIAAYVRISGGWGGTIALHAPNAVARQAASIMFNIPEASVTEAEIQDAFGELANQVGGNLKVLLPEPCHLSLPTVVGGREFLAQIPAPELLLEFVAESSGLPVVVTMVETLPSRDAFHARFHETHNSPA